MEANLNEILTEVETQIEECETTYNRLVTTISILMDNEYFEDVQWAKEQLEIIGNHIPETLDEYRGIVSDIRAEQSC